MSERNEAAIRRFWEEVFNGRNLGLIDDLFLPDYVYHGGAGQEVRGPDGLKAFLRVYLDAFSDMRVKIEDIFSQGDRVVSRATCRGTHKGALMGIPPTGKQVEVTVICVNRFVGDKIAEDWELVDLLGMMQQLGVVQPLGKG